MAQQPCARCRHTVSSLSRPFLGGSHLVAHDCGYPLSRYTCRATRVTADFLDFIAFCRCSTGVALHPLKISVSHPPLPVPGGVAPKFGSEKVSRYTGVSQLVAGVALHCATKGGEGTPAAAETAARIAQVCLPVLQRRCLWPSAWHPHLAKA